MTSFNYKFPTDNVDHDPGKVSFINWIRCSDRMPPDDETEVILNTYGVLTRTNGMTAIRVWLNPYVGGTKWIPFDEATWRKLNELPNT